MRLTVSVSPGGCRTGQARWTVEDIEQCTFSTHFTVPHVGPGRYKITVWGAFIPITALTCELADPMIAAAHSHAEG